MDETVRELLRMATVTRFDPNTVYVTETLSILPRSVFKEFEERLIAAVEADEVDVLDRTVFAVEHTRISTLYFEFTNDKVHIGLAVRS